MYIFINKDALSHTIPENNELSAILCIKPVFIMNSLALVVLALTIANGFGG